MDNNKDLRENQKIRLTDEAHLIYETTLSRLEKVALLSKAQKSTRETRKMKK